MENIAQAEPQINVSVSLPKSVDKAVELAVVERETTKRQLIEDAIRAFLGLNNAAA